MKKSFYLSKVVVVVVVVVVVIVAAASSSSSSSNLSIWTTLNPTCLKYLLRTHRIDIFMVYRGLRTSPGLTHEHLVHPSDHDHQIQQIPMSSSGGAY